MTFSLPLLSLLLLAVGCATNLPGRGGLIRVAIDDRTIQEVPLERYVAGVLEKEVTHDWPMEALKAQAVASRTYALYRKGHPREETYDVRADFTDQVFQKRRRYPPSILQAVLETEGEFLTFEGAILPAFFHSCCGGTAERGDRVWEDVIPLPLLSQRTDPYCSACPRAHWEYTIPKEGFVALLAENGYWLDEGWEMEVTDRDESGRVAEIGFRSKKGRFAIPGTTFRQILGYENLRSTLFEILPSGESEDSGNETVGFSGRGAGHGVGLCQWGTKGMADQGHTYQEILEFYYPGAELWTSPSLITNSQENSLPSVPSPDATTPE